MYVFLPPKSINMAISLAAIVTAYDALGTLVTTTKAAKLAIDSQAARPIYPVDTEADADYNSVTTAIAAWDVARAALVVTYLAAIAAQKAGELTTTNLMGPSEWFKMTGLANWGGHATQYIAIRDNQPTNADNLEGATLYTITTNRLKPNFNYPSI